jgi:hypothetical protein
MAARVGDDVLEDAAVHRQAVLRLVGQLEVHDDGPGEPFLPLVDVAGGRLADLLRPADVVAEGVLGLVDGDGGGAGRAVGAGRGLLGGGHGGGEDLLLGGGRRSGSDDADECEAGGDGEGAHLFVPLGGVTEWFDESPGQKPNLR